MKRLNTAIYGNAARRYRLRLRVIPVLEIGHYKGWHFHAALEPPAHVTFEAFKCLIHIHWSKIYWANRVDLVRPYADEGWIKYMLKLRQKFGLENWSDSIDWESLHNPIADA